VITTVIWSAVYTDPVCQKVYEMFPSATFSNPFCQKVDAGTIYILAQYTDAVCQVTDNSVAYTFAEFTDPVCQQVDNTVFMIIHLQKTPAVIGEHLLPNQMTIKWGYKNMDLNLTHFETKIKLNSSIRVQDGLLLGIDNIDIGFIAYGESGLITQTVAHDRLIGFIEGGTVLTEIIPDNVDGRPIEVVINLN
jgi:hypothetical protein